MEPTKFVVAVGNAWGGVWLTGPFDTHEEAEAYTHRLTDEWNIAALADPTAEVAA